MNSVVFRAFRAVDEPDTCLKFIEGHRKVLESYGITMITSNNVAWINHHNTYVIIVESVDDCRKLGGVKVQVADNQLSLPIVDAVSKIDPKIVQVIDLHSNGKIAEACGMWNSREIAGLGYSYFLLRAAVALATQIGVSVLYALAAPVTVNMCLNVGFYIDRRLGNNGYFDYPKLDLVATAMVIDDLEALNGANTYDKSHIDKLVVNPVQVALETGSKDEIVIDYRIKITTSYGDN